MTAATPRSEATHAKDRAEGAADTAAHNTALDLLTRWGFVAYAVLHVAIAWLAVQIAFGRSAQEGDQSGAFQTLAGQPFGRVLLVVIVIGLVAMAAWQALIAITGHRDEHGARRAVERVGSAARTLIYGGLAWTAIRVIAGSPTSSAQKQQTATAGLLGSPGGRVLVGLIGLGVLAAGVGMAVYGLRGMFERKLMREQMRHGIERTARWLGRIGYLTKGIAFAIVGFLLGDAAVRVDPGAARGLDAALRTLAGKPFGRILLLLVALGFLAFSGYCLVQARYRKVKP